jgi:YD repeat-containing protein
MLSETVITEETGVEGWKSEFTYDSAGNKLTEKDPLGNITRYTYGAFGRLLTQTDPLGNTATNTYSKSGNLLFYRSSVTLRKHLPFLNSRAFVYQAMFTTGYAYAQLFSNNKYLTDFFLIG